MPFVTLPEDIIYTIGRIIRTHRFAGHPCCKRHERLEGDTCTLGALCRTSRQLHQNLNHILHEQIALEDGASLVNYICSIRADPNLASAVKAAALLGFRSDPSLLLVAAQECSAYSAELCETWQDEYINDLDNARACGQVSASRVDLLEHLPNIRTVIILDMGGVNDRLAEEFERGTLLTRMQWLEDVYIVTEPTRGLYCEEIFRLFTLPRIHTIDVVFVQLTMPESSVFKPTGSAQEARGTSSVVNVSLRGFLCAIPSTWDAVAALLNTPRSLERITVVEGYSIPFESMRNVLLPYTHTLTYMCLLSTDGFYVGESHSLRDFVVLRQLVVTDGFFKHTAWKFSHEVNFPDSVRYCTTS